MVDRKGIILAGGSGTRLYPSTLGVSKQLLPVYDKPMIYYPLSVLMLSGVHEILIITTRQDEAQFKRLLGDGSQWGIELNYKVQEYPEGVAHAFIISQEFLEGSPAVLILGDNIFFGHGLAKVLHLASQKTAGATILGYHVNEPERYGVVDFDENHIVKSIIEKPQKPLSNYAVTGIYFVDETASERCKKIQPSERGELEITTLLESYRREKLLNLQLMGRGFAWLDTGTVDSLLDAGNFVRTLTTRQGLQVGSPDEVALKLGLIDKRQLSLLAEKYNKNSYGEYLTKISEGVVK